MATHLSDVMTTLLTTSSFSPLTPSTLRGRVRCDIAVVSVAAADNDADLYPVIRMRNTARIISIQVQNTAITSGTDYDLGLYAGNAGGTVSAPNWNQTAGTLITSAADVLWDGQSMASARTGVNLLGTGTDGAAAGTTNFGKPLYTIAGITTAPDPGILYDIVLTANTVGSAAGTISFAFLYLAGD